MARHLLLPWIGRMEVNLGTIYSGTGSHLIPKEIAEYHNGFPKGGSLRKLEITLGQLSIVTDAELSVLLTRFLMHAEARERLSMVQHLDLSSEKVSTVII